MYSMGNWTIFAFLIVAALMTCYVWYVFGSHSGYRTGAKTQSGQLEVLDGNAQDETIDSIKTNHAQIKDKEAV